MDLPNEFNYQKKKSPKKSLKKYISIKEMNMGVASLL